MSSNINTTNNINPKFIVSSNNNTEDPTLDLARKALNCITHDDIAPTQVAQAYQRVFKVGSTKTSRSKVYVAVLVFKKTQGYFPESLDELTEHISEYSPEEFVFDKPELAKQYLAEITSDVDYVTEDSTVYNLTTLRNITNKTTESKLFHTTAVTQLATNITKPNIKNELITLAKQINTLNNAEDEEMSTQL